MKVEIWTDGAYRDGRYAWAFVTSTGHEAAGVGDNPVAAAMHNVAGELAAVFRALVWARDNGFDEVVINHDYEGVGAWATGRWKTKKELTRQYVEVIRRHESRGMKIRFNHVRGHSGVPGNERADQLAMAALNALI